MRTSENRIVRFFDSIMIFDHSDLVILLERALSLWNSIEQSESFLVSDYNVNHDSEDIHHYLLCIVIFCWNTSLIDSYPYNYRSVKIDVVYRSVGYDNSCKL